MPLGASHPHNTATDANTPSMTISAAPDPGDRDESLPSDTIRKIAAINDRAAAALRDAGPEHAAMQEAAVAAYQHLNAAKQQARDALSDVTLFERVAGSNVETPSRRQRVAVGGSLCLITAGETALGFKGVKAALGNFGDGDLLSDPLALLAAVGFGVTSAWLAGVAGKQLAGCERSVLGEPAQARMRETAALPVSVTDPSGPGVLPGSLLDQATPVPTLTPVTAAAPGQNDRDHLLFRDGRTRKVRLALGGSAVALGVGLWGINGFLRADYREMTMQTPTSGGTSLGSIVTQPIMSASGGMIENVLIALGIMLFCAMVVIVAASHTALGMRVGEIRRRADAKLRELEKAVKRYDATIRKFEKIRSTVAYERAHASNVEKTVRAGEEDAA